MSRMKARAIIAAAAGIFAASGAQADAPAIAALRYSANTGANIVGAGSFAARKDYVEDDLAGTRTRMQIPGLPDNANLADFHVEPNGDLLFAIDIGAKLGSTYFRPADVVRFDGSTFSREFDATAAGVPADVRCDGVARWGSTGKLALSFDRSFIAAGITIRPADVIVSSGGTFGAKLLDAQASGLPAHANVNAVDTIGTTDYVLVAFDAGGSVGGIAFNSSDILQLQRMTGSWSKRYSLRAFSDRWLTAGLDGLATVNVDTVFQNGLE
jgi:hypothetical protein